MRKPRLEDFTPQAKKRTPDTVNLTGVVPLQPKAPAFSEAPNSDKQVNAAENNVAGSKVVSQYRGSMVSRQHPTTIYPSNEVSIIQWVRKAVKEFGKEAATHRFTQAEKKAIAQIVFTYKDRDIRTTENEITRIAVNFLLQDYHQNGENSILHKCLQSLNA